MERTLAGLAALLERRFQPGRAAGVDMCLRLATGEGDVFVRIADQQVVVDPPEPGTPDVTFYFNDLETAWRILLGEANAIEAFMSGRFRADGYLMMAFRLMEMFASTSLPPTPND